MLEENSLPKGIKSYVNVDRAYFDISSKAAKEDAILLIPGFVLMFVYVQVMLGKFTCVQGRSFLAFCGLSSIGLSLGFTYGFCSAFGFFYSPMANLVPFLALGIGIDDMFVIMQCFDNLSHEERNWRDIPKTISLTMRRAGVAITVTSFTDFMVFAIGSTTVLPALRSFCVWCAVGILVDYIFQITFFTAALALDCKRLVQGRNGLCPCYKHKQFDVETIIETPDEESMSKKLFSKMADIILSLPGVIVVLAVAGAFFCISTWQATLLRQEFQSIWFLPPSSYLRQWYTANER